jgi:hypothetical protein
VTRDGMSACSLALGEGGTDPDHISDSVRRMQQRAKQLFLLEKNSFIEALCIYLPLNKKGYMRNIIIESRLMFLHVHRG